MDLAAIADQTFGPYPMRVCLEKVREYVDVTGDDPDRWVEAAPPGYLAAALFVVAPDLLDQLAGYSVIHGEQTFRWSQPLTMEADLTVSGTVSRVRERGDTTFVGFELTVTGGDHEIGGGSSLFLVAPTSDASPGSIAPAVGPVDNGSPSAGQRSATRSDLVRYAAATRDWNPIHWDHGAARDTGLDGVVVHGLLQASWALQEARGDSDDMQPFSSAKIRFRNPLSPAQPVSLTTDNGDEKKTVTLTHGETVVLTAQVEMSNG